MVIKFVFFICLFFFSSLSIAQTNSHAHHKQAPTKKEAETNKMLIENKGQWPSSVLFRTNMTGGKVWLQQKKMIYHLQDYSAMQKAHAMQNPSFQSDAVSQTVIHVNFEGANIVSTIEKVGKSKFYYNFFKGKDPSKWASDVHGYRDVVLKEFYSGVDFNLKTEGEIVKYEFHVKPYVSPSIIQLSYAGQKNIFIDSSGNLILETDLGKVIEKKPYAYQLINGKEIQVECDFELSAESVSFKLGKYNSNYSLVIDPTLIFATYDGANSDNFGMTATYGHDGSAYSGGTVYGNDYPNPDTLAFDINSNFTVFNGNYGITDVFLSKYSADGTQMLWGTFLGGGDNNTGTETANSLICDANDNLYVFGATSSFDFPITPGAFDSTHNGGGTESANFYFNGVYFQNSGTDIYVAKLSADGHALLGSTFVGGSGNDGISYDVAALPYNSVASYTGLNSNYGDQSRGEIMLDGANNILVASSTKSTNFPTQGAVQNTNSGGQDGVVFKLSADFQNLLFSTYYGGSEDDACFSVKVDDNQNVIFAGGTQSSNLLGTAGGWQATYGGGITDGFVAKLNPTGSSLIQASYIGKTQYDQVFFVEIDRMNNVFLLGQSVGGQFPIFNAAYSNGNSSNFILKLNPALTSNLASTRFGNGLSSIHISPAAFLVDVCGNIYVSGWGANILQATPLTGMPVTPDAFQANSPNGFDFYLFVLKGDFNSLLYATYLGGNQAQEHVDGGTSRFDKNGIVYQSVCGGCGSFSDFPTTTNAWSNTNNSSNCNNIIYKFSTEVIPIANFTADQTIGCADFTVTFDNFSTDDDTYLWDFGNGNTDTSTFNPVITFDSAGAYTVFLYVTDSVCQLTDTAQITIQVVDPITINLPQNIFLCNSNPFNLVADSDGTANSFIWSTSSDFSNPLNNPIDSNIIVSSAGSYYVQASNGLCSATDSTVVVFDAPSQASFTPSDSLGCGPLTISFENTSVFSNYFLWDFGNGELDSVNFEPSVTYSSAGTYTISLLIADPDCPTADTAYFSIEVIPAVISSLNDLVSLCDTIPVLLVGNTNGTAIEFIWSSSSNLLDTLNSSLLDSSLNLTNPQSGYYFFSATNGVCSLLDSVEIDFTTISIELSAIDSICAGDLSTVVATNLNPTVSLSYSWSPSSIIPIPSTSNTVSVLPTFSQNVYVTATANGCVVDDSIFINVSAIDPLSVIASASQYIVAPGTTVTLFGAPSGLLSYSWSPITGLSNADLQQTNAVIDETTNYTLTVSDGICTRSDTVEVKVYEIICEDPYVFIPNAFSPNGDNNNDVLFVRGLFIEIMIFRVFDRWGEMVFESSDPAIGWDGTFRDKKLDPDVYDYYLDVTCIGGLKSISKGNVTLMK
jgi:gliding motility-associated-like protein